MKTKLIIQIEVEETLTESEELIKKLMEAQSVKLSDLFSPDADVICMSVGSLHAVSANRTANQVLYQDVPEDPIPTQIELKMYTRGIR